MKIFILFLVFSASSQAIELTQSFGKGISQKTQNKLKVILQEKVITPKVIFSFLPNLSYDTGRKNILQYELKHNDLNIGHIQIENARVFENGKEKTIPGIELVLIINSQSDKGYKCVGSALLFILKEVFLAYNTNLTYIQKKQSKIYLNSIESAQEFYKKFGFSTYQPPDDIKTAFNMVHSGASFVSWKAQLKKCKM
jgi:hypothetical protein